MAIKKELPTEAPVELPQQVAEGTEIPHREEWKMDPASQGTGWGDWIRTQRAAEQLEKYRRLGIDEDVIQELIKEPEPELYDIPGQPPSLFTGEEQQVAGGGSIGKFIRERGLKDIMETVGAASSKDTARLLDESAVGRWIDPLRTDDRNFSLHSIQNRNDIHELIDDTSIKISGQYGRGPRTWDETRAAARDPSDTSLPTIEEITGRKTKGMWNAEQLVRARMLLVASADEIMTDAKRIRTNPNTSTEELWIFRKKLSTFVGLQREIQGAVAEAGRALNAMKTPIGANEIAMSNFEETLKVIGGRNVSMKMAQLIAESGGDPVKIAKISRDAWYRRGWNALMEVWINGLLSAPSTHATNMLGNTINIAVGVGERYGAMGIGKLRSGIKRAAGRGGVDKADRVSLDEANAYAYGTMQGFGFMWRAFHDGIVKSETLGTSRLLDPHQLKGGTLSRRPSVTAENLGLDETGVLGRAVDLFGKYYVRMPGRFLEAADDAFKANAYVAELNALATRTAQGEGLQRGTVKYDKRVHEIVNNPPQDLHAGAYNYARYQTFTNDLTGRYEKWALDFSRTPIGRLFLPFVRTPTNIIKYGLARSPVGVVMPSVLRDLAAGGAKSDLAIARIAGGSMTLGLGYWMFANYETDENGKEVHRPIITGAGPTNYKMRQSWEASGIEEYSIYINGKYYKYNRYEPFGIQLGAMATFLELINATYDHTGSNKEMSEMMSAAVVGVAEYMTDKSFMQGFAQLMELVDMDPNQASSKVEKFQRFGARMGGSFVPNWLSKVAQDVDPVMRSRKGGDFANAFLNNVKTRVPWWSKTAPVRVDMFGNEILRADPIFYIYAISPSMVSIANKNGRLAKHIIENGVEDKTPRQSSITTKRQDVHGSWVSVSIDLMDVDPSGHLFADYKKILGKARRKALDQLVESRSYRVMKGNTEARKKLIEQEFNGVRDTVNKSLFGITKSDLYAYKGFNKYRDKILKEISAVLDEQTNKAPGVFTLPPHMTEIRY